MQAVMKAKTDKELAIQRRRDDAVKAKKNQALDRKVQKETTQQLNAGQSVLRAIDDKAAYDSAAYAVQNNKAEELRKLAATAPKNWDVQAKMEYEKKVAAVMSKYATVPDEIVKAAPSKDACDIDDLECQANAVARASSVKRAAAKMPKVAKKVSTDEAEDNAALLYGGLGVVAVLGSVGVVQRKMEAAALAAQSAGPDALSLVLTAVALGGVGYAALALLGSDSAAAPAEAEAAKVVGVVEPTAVVDSDVGMVTPTAAPAEAKVEDAA